MSSKDTKHHHTVGTILVTEEVTINRVPIDGFPVLHRQALVLEYNPTTLNLRAAEVATSAICNGQPPVLGAEAARMFLPTSKANLNLHPFYLSSLPKNL